MSYERFRASIKDPALGAVVEHWNIVRSGRPMPAWQDIDPASIKEHLPIVWAWRWDPELNTFIGRLAGEEILAVLRTHTRGKRIDECFATEACQAIFARFKQVIDGPALMHSHGKVYVLGGRDGQGERIVLPLGADGTLGDGVIGATVYRLGIRPTTKDKISVDHLNEVTDFFPLT
jgi:hypothetical protein